MKPVWIIDDDRSIRWVFEKALTRENLPHRIFDTAEAALRALERETPGAVLSDIRMPGMSGLEFMEQIKAVQPRLPIIIMTAYSDLDSAVSAFQGGAFEYLPKPFDVNHALELIHRALEEGGRGDEAPGLDSGLVGQAMLGQAPAMQDVFRAIGRLSQSHATVLITGETGTGKELVAHALHRHSPRKDKPFIALNTAAIPKDLLESELFGHERGAFTGADRRKDGLIEVADGGTVFLDEIGEIGGSIQAKLLRVLETSRFRRLGGTRDISVNVRFITATNRDLKTLADQSSFRSDLYYRLSPFSITVPPLRERKMDIIPLARHFLEGRSFLRSVPKNFHSSSERALEAYHWPGNIRELRNAVERGLLMSADSPVILPQHLALPSSNGGSTDFILSFPHQPTLEEVKQTYIDRMLHAYSGNRHQAALAMGISERTLFRHAKESNESR